MSLTLEKIIADLTEITLNHDVKFVPFHNRNQAPSFSFGPPEAIQTLVLVDPQHCSYGNITVSHKATGMDRAQMRRSPVTPPHGGLEAIRSLVERDDYRDACALGLNVIDYILGMEPEQLTHSSGLNSSFMCYNLQMTAGDFVITLQLEFATEAPKAPTLYLDYEYYFTPRYWGGDGFDTSATMYGRIEDKWIPILSYRVMENVTATQSRLKLGVDKLVPKLMSTNSHLSPDTVVTLLEEMRQQFVGLEYISISSNPAGWGAPQELVVVGQNPFIKTRYEIRFNANDLHNLQPRERGMLAGPGSFGNPNVRY